MTSTANILICAAMALACFTALGWPFARRAVPGAPSLFIAPALGWAIQSALALLVFMVLDFSRTAVGAALIAPAMAALAFAAVFRPADKVRAHDWRVVFAALVVAGLIAAVVMAGVLPKSAGEGVTLAGPIFDHSKIAMIDEMVRVGVPPANPFYGEAGQPPRLSYYYLWHFSAAEIALMTGASGWEADAALTWFTAFASLLLMAGLAVWLSGRTAAALIVMALAATSSLRPLAYWLGWEGSSEYLGYESGFGGWLFQTSWAPQHTASAMSAVLAILSIVSLSWRWSAGAFAALVLGMAASFQSSTWIGAFFLPLAAIPVSIMMLLRAEPARRLQVAFSLAGAALVALAMIAPLLLDQISASILRGGGAPIALVPYKVLGDSAAAEPARTILNLPAFWLVFLPVEWPAFYLAGIAGMFAVARGARATFAPAEAIYALAISAVASLLVAWLLASVIGDNNDLGWRAALPAVFVLIAAAAAAMALWIERRALVAMTCSAALLLAGLPGAALIARSNIAPAPSKTAADFSASAALWDAVRSHAGPRDRIANNALFLEHATPWPVNISWALLSNRRSCYPGPELTRPFAAISRGKLEDIDALFVRLFAGKSSAEDDRRIASDLDCSIVVVTPQDGAWTSAPFAASGRYRLVEDKPGWRIYARSN